MGTFSSALEWGEATKEAEAAGVQEEKGAAPEEIIQVKHLTGLLEGWVRAVLMDPAPEAVGLVVEVKAGEPR